LWVNTEIFPSPLRHPTLTSDFPTSIDLNRKNNHENIPKMGRELQKKKRRSSKHPVRQSQKPKKAPNPLGNSIIAKNW